MKSLNIVFWTSLCLVALSSTCALAQVTEKGTGTVPESVQADLPYVEVAKTLPGSGAPWTMHMVQTKDAVYIPIGIRTPDGDGPFPLITMGFGEGREGVAKIEFSMHHYEGIMDYMLDRGYAVAFINYRNEVPRAYNSFDRPEYMFDSIGGNTRALRSSATLDSEDYISIIGHVKSLPYVDKDAVGSIGVSHSGEMILKGLSVIDIAAAVPIEPAAHEYLDIDMPSAPRDEDGREVQLQDVELAKDLARRGNALPRLRNLNTPLLIMGRDKDHLQGIFRLSYEWLADQDKDVTWASFDHPVHGYPILVRDGDKKYAPDKMQQESIDLYMAFFDKHLKKK